MFKLQFATDNAAFDDEARGPEAARILRQIAENIETGAQLGGGPIKCANGHTIGHWEQTPFARPVR